MGTISIHTIMIGIIGFIGLFIVIISEFSGSIMTIIGTVLIILSILTSLSPAYDRMK